MAYLSLRPHPLDGQQISAASMMKEPACGTLDPADVQLAAVGLPSPG